MEEKNYRIDLLEAQNAKLTKSERIYRMICESSEFGYIYQNLTCDEMQTFGAFENLFGVKLQRSRDFDLLYDKFFEEDRHIVVDTFSPKKKVMILPPANADPLTITSGTGS